MKNVEDIYALAPEQRDAWQIHCAPSSVSRPIAVWHTELRFADAVFAGESDSLRARWIGAFEHVLAKHAVLRTMFVCEDRGSPRQVVRQRVEPVVVIDDARGDAPEEQQRRVEDLVSAEQDHAFDVSQAPLWRTTLVVVEDAVAHLVLTYHPLIIDRLSAVQVLAEALAARRKGQQGTVTAATRSHSYRDHVVWANAQDTAHLRELWKSRFGGYLAPRRSSAPPNAVHVAGKARVDLPRALAEGLDNVARSAGVTVGGVVGIAWALLLQREGEQALPVGLEVAIKPDRPASAPLALGPRTKVVPINPSVPRTATIGDVLREVRPDDDGVCRNACLSLEDMLRGAPLEAAVAGPPPTIRAAEGVEARTVRWIHALPAAPIVVEVPSNRPTYLELIFDRRRYSAAQAREVGAQIRALLLAFASGRNEIGDLLDCDWPAITAGSEIDRATIEKLLQRHESVRAARVCSERTEGRDRTVAYVQISEAASGRTTPVEFSLFYFADADRSGLREKYRLYLDTARFADLHGFAAVWTPERHFHENGGLYPNPSVLSAALAAVTKRIALRAGSVVLPLHHTARVAEEWSVVDNLSGGRVGLSFASGWVPNDFAFFPERYADKRGHMFRQIEDLRRLWRGERVPARDGLGNAYEVGIFPRPIQTELPIWITCSGDPAVFEATADLGHSVLTALVTLSVDEMASLVAAYRNRLLEATDGRNRGHVTVMIHTYVGENEAETRELVRPALSEFLRSHVGLVRTARKSAHSEVENSEDDLVSFAFEKYYRAASLIGAEEKCLAMVERLRAIGVDELACLIDFGLDYSEVLQGVERLSRLKQRCDRASLGAQDSLRAYLAEHLPAAAMPDQISIVPELPGSSSSDGRIAAGR